MAEHPSDVNCVMNGKTRRGLLASAAGALAAGTVGCTQYPEGKNTLPPKGPGTQNGEEETQAPQGTQSGNTSGSGNNVDRNYLNLDSVSFKEMTQITPQESEFNGSGTAVLSKPQKIAQKIPSELYEEERNLLIGDPEVLELIDYKNVANRMSVPGYRAVRGGFDPNTLASDLENRGYSKISDDDMEVWKSGDSDNPTEVISNGEILIVTQTSEEIKEPPTDQAIKAYNGEFPTYDKIDFISNLPEMEGDRQEIYIIEGESPLAEYQIRVEDHKIQQGKDKAQVTGYELTPDGDTIQNQEEEYIEEIFGDKHN